jgi:hypothetical protein
MPLTERTIADLSNEMLLCRQGALGHDWQANPNMVLRSEIALDEFFDDEMGAFSVVQRGHRWPIT